MLQKHQFMKYDVKQCLQDIIDHTDEMNRILSDITGFKHFEQDMKARRATERLFEIIGMRNKIAHGYDAVDIAVL